MQRDNQPIHNIGFGVTSRNIGDQKQDEDISSSPNSGFISKALDGNPFLKMATALVATGVAATVAGKFVRNQGLKLGLKLTQSAARAEANQTANIITRAHGGMLKIRSTLDQLEGVTRDARGTRELVFSKGGRLTTGYEGIASYVGSGYDVARTTRAGDWTWRNDLQQSLIRQARRLPYEVPAFYVADKTVGRVIHGGTEDSGPRKKWYDPTRVLDIGKDLAKTAALQLGGFMLPIAAAGASKNSSLNFYRTAEARWDASFGNLKRLTPTQKKLYESTNFLRGSLQEVGTDVFDVLGKAINFSERSTGAMSLALSTMNNVHKNPVQDLYAGRHGTPPNMPRISRRETAKKIADDILAGNTQGLNSSLSENAKLDNLLDLIPGYKAIRQGLIHGSKEYKNLKAAQVFLDTSDLDAARKLIIRTNKFSADAPDSEVGPILRRTIDTINRRRTSPINQMARDFEEQVGIRVDPFGEGRRPVSHFPRRDKSLSVHFKKEMFDGEYRRRLIKQLENDHGVDRQTAEKFVHQLYFDDMPFKRMNGSAEYIRVAPEERITLGGRKPEANFFEDILERYNEGKIGRTNPLGISSDNLRSSIDALDNEYEAYFRLNLRQKYGNINLGRTADELTKEFETKDILSVLRTEKLNESDTTAILTKINRNQISKTSAEYINHQNRLLRAIAEVAGYDSSSLNQAALVRVTRSQGLDPDNLAQIQGYLLRNKKMTASQFGSLADFFGAKRLSLDAYLKQQTDLFKSLRNANLIRPNEESVYFGNIAFEGGRGIPTSNIRQIIAGAAFTQARAKNVSTVKGYYTFGNNQTLNVNPVSSGLKKTVQFLTEEVRIPIIGINPLQMVGIKDFQSMSEAGRYRISSAAGAHPFISKVADPNFKTDLYAWHSTGGIFGTKGKLSAFQANRVTGTGEIGADTVNLPGTYRPLPVRSTGMFTRTANLAAGQTVATSTGSTSTRFSDRVKEKLSFDPEQPNSLFRYAGRLINRQSDINNQAVMARIIDGDIKPNTPFSVGGFGRRKSLVLKDVKDPSGSSVGFELRDAVDDSIVASHGQLMEAFTRFADTTLAYGFNKKATAALYSAADSPLLTSLTDGVVTLRGVNGGPSVQLGLLDDLLSPKTASSGSRLIQALRDDLENIRLAAMEEGAAPSAIENYKKAAKAFSRIEKFEGITDFSKQSKMYQTSASIANVGDELGFEAARYLLQRNAFLSGTPAKSILEKVTSTIDDLTLTGSLTTAQKAEAQIATSSTAMNIAAFDTYLYEQGSNSARKLNKYT